MEPKIQIEQEFHLHSIHFCSAYTSNPGIIGIVITIIIQELCSYHDACDQKTVCIQGGKIGIRLLKELVDVYIGNNKARSAAPRVLEYAFDVLSNAQGISREQMQ